MSKVDRLEAELAMAKVEEAWVELKEARIASIDKYLDGQFFEFPDGTRIKERKAAFAYWQEYIETAKEKAAYEKARVDRSPRAAREDFRKNHRKLVPGAKPGAVEVATS